MGVLIDIDLEDGTLNEFDSTVTDGGDLSVETAAALAGTVEGLQLVVDSTNSMFGRANFTWTTSDLRLRFYIDMNSLAMSNGDQFKLIQASGGAFHNVFLNRTGGVYTINGRFATDGGSTTTNTAELTDAPHYIEIHQRRASSNVASDGFVKIYIDGPEVSSNTGLDIFDVAVPTGFDWGARDLDAGTSGTFYLDQLIVNDDGGEIGAHGAPAGLLLPVGSLGLMGVGR